MLNAENPPSMTSAPFGANKVCDGVRRESPTRCVPSFTIETPDGHTQFAKTTTTTSHRHHHHSEPTHYTKQKFDFLVSSTNTADIRLSRRCCAQLATTEGFANNQPPVVPKTQSPLQLPPFPPTRRVIPLLIPLARLRRRAPTRPPNPPKPFLQLSSHTALSTCEVRRLV